MSHPHPMRCASCGYLCDVVSGLNTPNEPKPGDVTLCLNCGMVLVLTLFGARPADPAELEEILSNPIVAVAVAHIRARGFIPDYHR